MPRIYKKYFKHEDKETGHSIAAAKSLQSCPILCDPIDGSPPGSSVHGIFQARELEWGAIAFSMNAVGAWPKKKKSLFLDTLATGVSQSYC